MAAVAKHSAPPRPEGKPGRVAALAAAIRGLLRAPASGAAQREVDVAVRGCTTEEYEAAWALAAVSPAPAGAVRLPALVTGGRGRPVIVAVLVALIAAGLGTYAAAASYDTVSHLAAAKNVALPRLNPIGIDGGLAGVIILDIIATWLAEPIWWLRLSARVFAVATVAANAAAGWPDPVGTGLRVAAPVLFVVITEAGRTLLLRGKKAEERKQRAAERARRAQARRQRRGDRIPRIRWALDCRGTWALWKRMRLWQEPSYSKAVAMELDRLAAIQRLAAEYYPGDWRNRVPADLVWMLESGVRMAEALGRVGELLAGQGRERSLEAELRDLRASVSAQLDAARGERAAEVGALRRDLETARADLESARGDLAEALARAQRHPRASAPKKRPKVTASAPADDASALDSDPTTELRAVMELRARPELLGPRMGGELARKLGIGGSTARRLRDKLVKDGALSEYALSLIEAPAERSR